MLLIAGAAGCRRAEQDASARNAAAMRQLAGVWDVSLSTDPVTVFNSAAPSAPVRGSFAFLVGAQGIGNRVIGVSDIDFRVHPLSPRTTGMPMRAEVRRVEAGAKDSLFMTVDEEQSGFVVRLDGVLAGDSAWGRWTAESRSTGGAGQFTMRRHAQ